MKWDNPSPGVWEALGTRTTEVSLEVFEPGNDPEFPTFTWWAFTDGRMLSCGEATSLEEAQEQCALWVNG